MAFENSITAFFGGDTTNLRASTQEASIMVKGFGTAAGRAVREIGEGFLGAVVFMEAVKGIRDIAAEEIHAAEAARDAGEAISDQAQAWLDIKDGVSIAGGAVKQFFVDLITAPVGTGAAIGGVISELQGVEPVTQALYQKIENDTDATIDRIAAAHKKFLTDLPQQTAEANAKIAKLDADLATAKLNDIEKMAALTKRQSDDEALLTHQVAGSAGAFNTIKDLKETQLKIELQELANAKERATIEEEMRTPIEKQKELYSEQLALEQKLVAAIGDQAATDQIITDLAKNRYQAQQATLQVNSEAVEQADAEFRTKQSTMTLDDQIAALRQKQAQYEANAASSASDEKVSKQWTNDALKVGNEIADDTAKIQKGVSLSDAQRLQMFEFQTASLREQSGLTQAQYNVLVQLQKVQADQFEVQQKLDAGYDQGTQDQKDQLATAQLQTAEDAKQLAILQAMSNTPPPPAEDANGNTPDDDAYNAEADDAAADTHAYKGGSDLALFGKTVFAGVDPSFGDEQLYEQNSVKNVQQQAQGQIVGLQERIAQLTSDGTKFTLEQIPALQKQIDALEHRSQNAYDFLFSPGYSDAIGPGSQVTTSPAAGTETFAQQQATSLKNIENALVPALTLTPGG